MTDRTLRSGTLICTRRCSKETVSLEPDDFKGNFSKVSYPSPKENLFMLAGKKIFFKIAAKNLWSHGSS